MEEKEYKVGFNEPLHVLDSETQTYGCRANNPDICANAFLNGICAFVNEDHICRRPSRAWKKQFIKLKEFSIMASK